MNVGLVAIGRNEGERLKRCLRAAVAQAGRVVYVDSGSTDGSVEFAKSLGIDVVELDLSIPFTAARARNAGYRRLVAGEPDMVFVQFVDGDCELQDGYLAKAVATFETNDKLAVVSGRRRERHRDASVYNLLCDQEWDTPVGDSLHCHGDAMMRREAFDEAGGFDDTMIAGEEPGLSFRLREKGWKLERIDAEMTLHDAEMTRFGQWWKRTMRAGHAYAELADKHGAPPERYCVDHVRSSMVWGLAAPLLMLAFALGAIVNPFSLIGTALILALLVRLYLKVAGWRRSIGDPAVDAKRYAMFTVISKLPQALGIIKYYRNKMVGTRSRLIEYKSEGAMGG